MEPVCGRRAACDRAQCSSAAVRHANRNAAHPWGRTAPLPPTQLTTGCACAVLSSDNGSMAPQLASQARDVLHAL